jgi:MSHA biogenesis protein MshP
MKRDPKQRGSALLVVLFSLVVLGFLGSIFLQNRVSEQSSTAESLLSSRAWFAAHSGMEWALSTLFPLTMPIGQCLDTQKVPLFLPQCVGVVRCRLTENDLYHLESEATCGLGKFKMTRVQTVWANGSG